VVPMHRAEGVGRDVEPAVAASEGWGFVTPTLPALVARHGRTSRVIAVGDASPPGGRADRFRNRGCTQGATH
jgi:hypothetical protein